jgi:hypothetical protein
VARKVIYQENVPVTAVETTIEETITVVVDGKEILYREITTEMLLGVIKIKVVITHGTSPEMIITIRKIHGISLEVVILLAVIIIKIIHGPNPEMILPLKIIHGISLEAVTLLAAIIIKIIHGISLETTTLLAVTIKIIIH